MDGFTALAEGRWAQARREFEAMLAVEETAPACFGLAMALWWLGESHACVERGSQAYALFRSGGDRHDAAQCAVWLAITYKSNFANFAAANGWIARAERLLEPADPGPLHGWLAVARAYRLPDLAEAAALTERAVALARAAEDVDLELVALSQLGLITVAGGATEAGFALIDEAMAATLAGERSTLDTVVYVCCDMLNACELASDLERATQWCQVADDFTARYGCPFLYAECRIYYGSVLTAKGRWTDAERELEVGARITEGVCPGLHARALTRLASLRIRQGRLEEVDQLLASSAVETEAEASLLAAALALARGDGRAATRILDQHLRHVEANRPQLADGLDLLVDTHLATGQLDAAAEAARRLSALADSAGGQALTALKALARGAQGRAALARGDPGATGDLEGALALWSSLSLPFEEARTRLDLATALVDAEPEAAAGHARRALGAFTELGARAEADRAAALLRSLGVVPRVGPKGTGLLTMREREVLALLGAGLSNPEIAERLHISRKTAAHHVSAILAKLGLRNRAEAAAAAVRGAGAGPVPGR